MRLSFLGVVMLLAGCSTLPSVTPADEAWLLGGITLPGPAAEVTEATVPPEDHLLAITPEMQRFAEEAVAGASTPRGKVRALLEAIIDPARLGLRFAEDATYGAAEVFERRRADCLSFTALFVALSRHVGLDAKFNEVDVPPVWDLSDSGTLIRYRHMNALIRLGPEHWQVVDILPEDYDSSFPQRPVSDREALAQYYNNLAVQFLLQDRLREAQQHLVRAIELAPRTSHLWGNLGSTYRRAGEAHAAKLAYVKAMRLDPEDETAIKNAARALAADGDTRLARALAHRMTQVQRRNPYDRYREGLEALAEGRYESALRHARAAIRLYAREHRFHYLLGLVHERLGNTEAARESFERAIELASGERAQRYQRRLETLLSAN